MSSGVGCVVDGSKGHDVNCGRLANVLEVSSRTADHVHKALC